MRFHELIMEIIRDNKLEPIEKCLLIDLHLYQGPKGQAFPSQKTLADHLGRSERQVRNSLKKLKMTGYLSDWKRRGYSKSNVYNLTKEVHFLNEDINRKSSTSDKGNELPQQSGNPLPPNSIQEVNQLSSSTVQQVEIILKRQLSRQECLFLFQLSKKYSTDWILDACKELVGRNKYDVIKIGLVTKVLEDWEVIGKPEPKPEFIACGNDGCENGYISIDAQNMAYCECRERYEQKYNDWKTKHLQS